MLNGDRIRIWGAGVTGLCCAAVLAEHGYVVQVEEIGPRIGAGASWKAGGMLAPWCESETAPIPLEVLASASVRWWQDRVPTTARNGTIVVAGMRDGAELGRFGRRTGGHETIGPERIGELEPALAGRFSRALFFPQEGHLDPRLALDALARHIEHLGGSIVLGADGANATSSELVIDASGYGASGRIEGLRGVRGEMALVRSGAVELARPVRLLHPRHPIYLVPRRDGVFMVGATMIESENIGPMTVRSAIDLLSALYGIHPAFADAEIIEFGADLRPTLPSHLPEISENRSIITVNGMYRHGFLLGPVMAERVLSVVQARFGRSHRPTLPRSETRGGRAAAAPRSSDASHDQEDDDDK